MHTLLICWCDPVHGLNIFCRPFWLSNQFLFKWFPLSLRLLLCVRVSAYACAHICMHVCAILRDIHLCCSALQPSASCGELTQFNTQHGMKRSWPGSQNWLRLNMKCCFGSGNVILIQPFSALRRKIKRRVRGEKHTELGELRERLGQSSVGSMCKCCLAPSPPGGYGSSVPHGVLMKWLLTSYVHNTLEAKWAETEREGGRERKIRAGQIFHCQKGCSQLLSF